MNKQNMIDRVLSLLQSSHNSEYTGECINAIKNGSVLFNEGSLVPKEDVYYTYEHRYQIQKQVTNSEVLGYETLLKNLKAFSKEEVRIMTLTSENKGYIVFTDEKLSFLIGILQSPYLNLKKLLEIQDQNSKKGFTSNGVLIFKGNIVQ